MKHLAVLALVLTTACKKEESSSSSSSSSKAAVSGDTRSAKATEPAKAPADTGPFASWDMAARRAAFQGAHVTPGSSLGAWEAWNVAGDQVTIWDGKSEKTLELAVVSPCEAKIIERGADGSTSSTTSHYTLRDGKLAKGLGDAGSRRGKEAVACISNTRFTLAADGTCTEWKASMFDDGKYEAKPGTCGFRDEGGKEVFFAAVNGRETTLDVHGDALLSDQLARVHSEPAADFAAAKTARDAR